MKTLADYFCPKQGAAFAKAVPGLREKIGVAPFSPKGSNYGISGNTFRAYTGWDEKPSKIYQQWAEKTCDKLDIKSLERHLETSEGFVDWHSSLAKSLQSAWRRSQGKPLSFAHQYKLKISLLNGSVYTIYRRQSFQSILLFGQTARLIVKHCVG